MIPPAEGWRKTISPGWWCWPGEPGGADRVSLVASTRCGWAAEYGWSRCRVRLVALPGVRLVALNGKGPYRLFRASP
ncbi:MAG TPA: hypothetical protein VGS79_29080 [Puia sp.]|nr:hypothetical protein [Puia sp.]